MAGLAELESAIIICLCGVVSYFLFHRGICNAITAVLEHAHTHARACTHTHTHTHKHARAHTQHTHTYLDSGRSTGQCDQHSSSVVPHSIRGGVEKVVDTTDEP